MARLLLWMSRLSKVNLLEFEQICMPGLMCSRAHMSCRTYFPVHFVDRIWLVLDTRPEILYPCLACKCYHNILCT